MENLNLNWLAIIVVAIIPLVTGFIWYSPKFFGTIWMKHSSMTEEKMKNVDPIKVYGLAIVFAFILATAMFFLGRDISNEPHHTSYFFTDGLLHGAMLAISVVLPVFATNALFEQKSFSYVAVNLGYWILTIALMGGVLEVWR